MINKFIAVAILGLVVTGCASTSSPRVGAIKVAYLDANGQVKYDYIGGATPAGGFSNSSLSDGPMANPNYRPTP